MSEEIEFESVKVGDIFYLKSNPTEIRIEVTAQTSNWFECKYFGEHRDNATTPRYNRRDIGRFNELYTRLNDPVVLEDFELTEKRWNYLIFKTDNLEKKLDKINEILEIMKGKNFENFMAMFDHIVPNQEIMIQILEKIKQKTLETRHWVEGNNKLISGQVVRIFQESIKGYLDVIKHTTIDTFKSVDKIKDEIDTFHLIFSSIDEKLKITLPVKITDKLEQSLFDKVRIGNIVTNKKTNELWKVDERYGELWRDRFRHVLLVFCEDKSVVMRASPEYLNENFKELKE